jgi:Endonuclease I
MRSGRIAMVVNPSVPSAKPADSGTVRAAVDQALAEFEAARAQPYYDEATDRADRDAYYAPLGGRPPPASALSNHLEATHSPRVRYDSGRSIYTWADLHEDQLLRSIYSGATFDPREAIADVVLLDQRIKTLEARMADGRVSDSAGLQEIDLLEAASPYNCEHVVPQSWFRRSEPMRGDMHHLFACGNRCNSFRGNTPYFDFPDFQDVVQDDCGKREQVDSWRARPSISSFAIPAASPSAPSPPIGSRRCWHGTGARRPIATNGTAIRRSSSARAIAARSSTSPNARTRSISPPCWRAREPSDPVLMAALPAPPRQRPPLGGLCPFMASARS